MLGATRTAAASSAHRIGPSPACHPSFAKAHNAFATSWGFMLGATRLTVIDSVCTRRSSILRPLAELPDAFASRLQAVAALHALNSPCSASTIERMLSASRARMIRVFSWISAAEGRPQLLVRPLPAGWGYSRVGSARALGTCVVRCRARSSVRASRIRSRPCSSRLGSSLR